MSESSPGSQRPDLTPVESKPDVLVRLLRLVGTNACVAFNPDLRDAIAVIEGLRASDERRLGMVNNLKVRVAALETAIRDIVNHAPTIGGPADVISAVMDYHELVVDRLQTALPAPQLEGPSSGNG